MFFVCLQKNNEGNPKHDLASAASASNRSDPVAIALWPTLKKYIALGNNNMVYSGTAVAAAARAGNDGWCFGLFVRAFAFLSIDFFRAIGPICWRSWLVGY